MTNIHMQNIPELLDKISSQSVTGTIILLCAIFSFLIYRIITMIISFKRTKSENARKEARADKYSSAIKELTTSMHQFRDGFLKSSEEHASLLKTIVALSKGYTSEEDSFQIIKDHIKGPILLEFQRLSATSIYRNHWSKNKMNIELKMLNNFNRIINHVIISLNASYNLSLNVEPFFPKELGNYILSNMSWDALREIHESKLAISERRQINDSEINVFADNVYIKFDQLFDEYIIKFEQQISDISLDGRTKFIKADYIVKPN